MRPSTAALSLPLFLAACAEKTTDVLQKLRNETLSAPATPYVPVPEEYRHDLPPPHRP